MRKLIYILGFLFIIFGCQNDDITYTYPIMLVPTEHKLTSEVKVFAKSGQITDRTVVDHYLATDSLGYFYSKSDTILPLSISDTIIYESRDKVLFWDYFYTGERIPKQEGRYTYFYLKDTLVSYTSFPISAALRNISLQIGIHKPFYEVFGSQPFLMYERMFDAKIAKGSPHSLEFPLLTYRLSRIRESSMNVMARKNYNNAFDKNVINLLETGDTLVIQEAKVTYKAID